MFGGIETLNEIEGKLQQLRAEISSLDSQKEQLFAQSQANKEAQAKLLEQIARIHLQSIRDQGEVFPEYGQIATLIQQRGRNFSVLKDRIAQLNETLSQKEASRAQAHAKLQEAQQRAVQLQQTVQECLKADAEYTRQLQQTQNARAVAERTAQKAQSSIDEYRQKMHPFEEDALFWYLYQRRFGTSEYRGRGVIKLLDGRVAALCDYERYRPIYWTLSQIPNRLQVHAEQKQAEYQKELHKLVSMEKAAAQKAGLEEAKAAVEEVQKAVDALDREIAEIEERLNQALAKQKTYLADEDDEAKQIVRLMTQTLQYYGVEDIYTLSQKTQSEQDDQLAAQLKELQSQEEAYEKAIAQNRARYQAKLQALQETEALRRRYKAERYDNGTIGFDNAEVVGNVLGEVLGGMLDGASAWERMRRHSRRQGGGWLSDFGSGAFPGADSPWFDPAGPAESGDLDFPDSGGLGGGIFPSDVGTVSDSDTFQTGGGF